MTSCRLADLTTAAEHYERLVRSGETKGEAFRAAMTGMGKARPGVIIPPELPGLIERIVRSQAGGDWRTVASYITSGGDEYYRQLRSFLYCVLIRFGYHPSSIGAALKRDRSTVLKTAKDFEKRLATNDLLRARVEAIVSAKAERKVAACIGDSWRFR